MRQYLPGAVLGVLIGWNLDRFVGRAKIKNRAAPGATDAAPTKDEVDYLLKREQAMELVQRRMEEKTDQVNTPKKRLEEALLTFIEREIKSTPPDAASVTAIPAMAEILIRLWGC